MHGLGDETLLKSGDRHLPGIWQTFISGGTLFLKRAGMRKRVAGRSMKARVRSSPNYSEGAVWSQAQITFDVKVRDWDRWESVRHNGAEAMLFNDNQRFLPWWARRLGTGPKHWLRKLGESPEGLIVPGITRVSLLRRGLIQASGAVWRLTERGRQVLTDTVNEIPAEARGFCPQCSLVIDTRNAEEIAYLAQHVDARHPRQ